MKLTEKEMRNYIFRYRFNIKDIDKLNRINDFYTEITANYDLLGGSSGGGNSSKVENFIIKREKEIKKYKQIKLEIDIVEDTIKQLKGKQKAVMELYIFNYKLTEIRDRLHIKSKAAVWNIKERAIKNMVKYANNTTKNNNENKLCKKTCTFLTK